MMQTRSGFVRAAGICRQTAELCLRPRPCRHFSATGRKPLFTEPLPAFLSSEPGHVDIVHIKSDNVMLQLATEEYLFEHTPLVNPLVLLFAPPTPTIVVGKNQNPWKECRVQLLEDDGVTLVRRKSGGGCVYQDRGNTCFSFINPIIDTANQDFKTMNNDILLNALKSGFGIEAQASGRNDLTTCHAGYDKKISGSAYKIKLDSQTQEGVRSLHHGTMLRDLELGALGKYLNPSKAKMESKGIDSVVSRVVNLREINPDIDHENFCKAVQDAFVEKWSAEQGATANIVDLEMEDLQQIPMLMEAYEASTTWEWRFGASPSFTNSVEKKFDWALVDFQFDVAKGVITAGQCFSDCLVPPYIDAINNILATGTITYDVAGIKEMCNQLREQFDDDTANEMNQMLKGKYTSELEQWLIQAI